jgi:hypothetical protein
MCELFIENLLGLKAHFSRAPLQVGRDEGYRRQDTDR